MKPKTTIIFILLFSFQGFSQTKTVALLPPVRKGGMPLMEALDKRCSTREFAENALPDQTLSNLLWAAWGVNREEGDKYIPKSVVDITNPFLGLRWDMNVKTSFEIIQKQFSVPLNEDEKIFVDFPNTALYSPVSYIPQAISIFIFRQLNLPPLLIFYGARLFTLLT
jgi:hypothetical protein